MKAFVDLCLYPGWSMTSLVTLLQWDFPEKCSCNNDVESISVIIILPQTHESSKQRNALKKTFCEKWTVEQEKLNQDGTKA